ncbi:spermidine/putrescine ABC transporter substrate-binding protein [Mariprofundus erugo]|uniref:Putrescine-binding periplasmic protein n=1 Tax=Mariprofundus erugo TaxID=2528639 RepID=A0A5R9GM70_9PROT|nr:spermidine/putrescine ABC transporter substrate-binding protein [Mariprofundus erugo]TLS65387.1 spermidine/putrescine ABC transporter substrate-binding protein [Mariprofundus erugo]TLS74861.1 spermidine/putrescine ABC transporter substrate-binding protein [Mariprofundus erugo]
MKKTLMFTLLMLTAQGASATEQLYLFNWNDYIAEDTVTRFEKQYDCKVVQSYYSSTDEMMAKLQAGASGYDVVIPTQNAVQALISQNKLALLDKAQLPNAANESSGFMNRSYDPDNRYSLPYAFTTTLIGFNESKLKELGIEADSWAVIFDPAVLAKLKGKVTVMDDAEELFSAALKYLGYSVNDNDPKHLEAAQQLIQKAKPYWASFNSSSYIKELAVGDIWVAHGYSSDMVQARNDAMEAHRPFTISFALPKEGAVLALDNMVIPKDAAHPKLAHEFINYLLEGKNAAELTNIIGAGNPNSASLPFISEEMKSMKAIFPDPATLAKLETLEARSSKSRRLLNKLWTEIKLK